MSPQTPAGTPDPVDVATTVATPLPEVGTPLPQVKVQPIDPGLAASQVAADRRIAQREAGVKDVPGVGESPTANPPEVVARKPRTPAEIEADMNATRERLTATLTQLQDTVQEAFAPATSCTGNWRRCGVTTLTNTVQCALSGWRRLSAR